MKKSTKGTDLGVKGSKRTAVKRDRFIFELLIVDTLLINLVKNKSCILNPLSCAIIRVASPFSG
jgi:hypothetical protein